MIARHSLPLVLAILLSAGCQANQAVQPPITASPMPGSGAGPDASASPSMAPVAGAALTGKVYDEDLNPLSGVTISAKPATGEAVTATTGADGAYKVSLSDGTYAVTAAKTGLTTRTQKVTVAGETTLDFGGLDVKPSNAYFLSTNPEIDLVTVKEAKPGGPLTLDIHFSEALTKESQTNFLAHLAIEARNGADFLQGSGDIDPKLDLTSTWDAAGQLLTLVYDEPYLASGPTETIQYNLRLEQLKKDQIDPVTDENVWEDMRIADAEKNPIGKNRADFVFIKPDLPMIGSNELINRAFGYSPSIRRWNLTHTSTFSFQAAKDTVGPGLESVKVDGQVTVGGNEYDLMALRFTEPMRVVRERDDLEFTRLDTDEDKEMLIVNVSKSPDGSNPEPLGSAFKVESFRFSKTDPNLVTARFPSGAFRDMKWVEVTLGKDLRDPADNKADAAKIKASGIVNSVEEEK